MRTDQHRRPCGDCKTASDGVCYPHEVEQLKVRVAELEAAICRHVRAREGESNERPDMTVAVLYRIEHAIKARESKAPTPSVSAQQTSGAAAPKREPGIPDQPGAARGASYNPKDATIECHPGLQKDGSGPLPQPAVTESLSGRDLGAPAAEPYERRSSNASSARQLCDGCNAPMPGPHLAGEPECLATTTTEQRPSEAPPFVPKSPGELEKNHAAMNRTGWFGVQADDAEAAERERCARHVETLANMVEEGAGPLNMPAARLRQAAQSIRSGKEASLWEPGMQANPGHKIPTPECGHSAQSWVIACEECGATAIGPNPADQRSNDARPGGGARPTMPGERWEDQPHADNSVEGLRAEFRERLYGKSKVSPFTDVNAEYYKRYDKSEECPTCHDATAKAIFAERRGVKK